MNIIYNLALNKFKNPNFFGERFFVKNASAPSSAPIAAPEPAPEPTPSDLAKLKESAKAQADSTIKMLEDLKKNLDADDKSLIDAQIANVRGLKAGIDSLTTGQAITDFQNGIIDVVKESDRRSKVLKKINGPNKPDKKLTYRQLQELESSSLRFDSGVADSENADSANLIDDNIRRGLDKSDTVTTYTGSADPDAFRDIDRGPEFHTKQKEIFTKILANKDRIKVNGQELTEDQIKAMEGYVNDPDPAKANNWTRSENFRGPNGLLNIALAYARAEKAMSKLKGGGTKFAGKDKIALTLGTDRTAGYRLEADDEATSAPQPVPPVAPGTPATTPTLDDLKKVGKDFLGAFSEKARPESPPTVAPEPLTPEESRIIDDVLKERELDKLKQPALETEEGLKSMINMDPPIMENIQTLLDETIISYNDLQNKVADGDPGKGEIASKIAQLEKFKQRLSATLKAQDQISKMSLDLSDQKIDIRVGDDYSISLILSGDKDGIALKVPIGVDSEGKISGYIAGTDAEPTLFAPSRNVDTQTLNEILSNFRSSNQVTPGPLKDILRQGGQAALAGAEAAIQENQREADYQKNLTDIEQSLKDQINDKGRPISDIISFLDEVAVKNYNDAAVRYSELKNPDKKAEMGQKVNEFNEFKKKLETTVKTKDTLEAIDLASDYNIQDLKIDVKATTDPYSCHLKISGTKNGQKLENLIIETDGTSITGYAYFDQYKNLAKPDPSRALLTPDNIDNLIVAGLNPTPAITQNPTL